MLADARAAGLLSGTRTMLAGECGAGLRALVLTDGAPVPARGGVRGRTPCACPYRRRTGSRSRGSAPSSAPGGASRTEPPLRVTGYAVRFSCTYRKGSPRYRRAFSAYINSLYMRHAGDTHDTVSYDRHTDNARGGVPPHRCLRHLEDGAPATHVRYAVNVQFHRG